MFSALWKGVAPLAAAVCIALPHASAQLISFEYTQSDKETGSGRLSGVVEGISFGAALPLATVTQNDESDLPVPEGMIGYMDGWSEAQPGNPFGVHLGWSGSITLTGEKIISASEVELYELELPLIHDQAGAADWRYEVELTDDDGQGNDAFGTGLRIAGWIGDKADGHRHSAGAFGTFQEGAVDRVTVVGTHGDVGGNGRNGNDGAGDDMGIGISLRNANGTSGPATFAEDGPEGTGPIYVDHLIWQGGFTADPANVKLVGTSRAGDLNGDGEVDLADFGLISANFNLDETTKATGDMNLDGRTDLRDFVLFRSAFEAAAGAAGAASVPEPSAGLLLLGGTLAVIRRRRRAC